MLGRSVSYSVAGRRRNREDVAVVVVSPTGVVAIQVACGLLGVVCKLAWYLLRLVSPVSLL